MKRWMIAAILTVCFWLLCMLLAPVAEAKPPKRAAKGVAVLTATSPGPKAPLRLQTTQSTRSKAMSLGPASVERFPGRTSADDAVADWRIVNAGYFATVNLPFVKGRNFTPAEGKEAPRVAIVDENLAQKLWPNQEPVGRRLRIDGDESPWMTVVGVVRHQGGGALEASTHGQLYFPYPETDSSSNDND